mmetsp:Transcript_5246/g.7365  ORF Transcript_5246/g.7365 Transcript_5246/m.7365 type:complete len:242 (+) Transcript_5246:16-741(+)
MVDKAKVASVVFGILAIIFYIGSLATPWFIVTDDYKMNSIDFKCQYTLLYFWEQLECSDSGNTAVENSTSTTYICDVCSNVPNNWRDFCKESTDENCGDLEQCFDITVALVASSAGLFVFGFIGVIIINVAEKLDYKATWMPVGLYSLALLVIIVPIVYFAIVFPSAYDSAGSCAQYLDKQDLTPCDVFSGSSTVSQNSQTEKITWGSAGWVLAVIVFFLDAVNLLQAVRGRRRDVIVPNY